MDHVRGKPGVSERRACRALHQHRSTHRKLPRGRADEARLAADMIELARQYGRYGYRRIAALWRDAGWLVNDKRVERLWRREGLKVPMKQPKKGRRSALPHLNDGSCVRLRPQYRNHVWSHDFVQCRTDDGKAFRMVSILDEHSRECVMIKGKRKLNSADVIDALTDLFILRGVPDFIRSDNGSEFVAQAVRDWIAAVGAKTAYIEPGSPWKNRYCESFNARFRDELLDGEVFHCPREAQIMIDTWRTHDNTKRPHSALGYRPPAPETIVPMDQRPVMHQLSNWTAQVRQINVRTLPRSIMRRSRRLGKMRGPAGCVTLRQRGQLRRQGHLKHAPCLGRRPICLYKKTDV